jgi:micrococcal nuclease
VDRPWAALVALTAAASLGGWWLGEARRGPGPGPATVTAVLDGDTIEVTWPAQPRTEVVRLLGVDTPETIHPSRPVQCFGPEASRFTRRRLLGQAVQLRFDRERRDRYGRLLAYVEVGDGRFNDELLRGGYARLLVIPPNGAHARAMLDQELAARARGAGLWGACS